MSSFRAGEKTAVKDPSARLGLEASALGDTSRNGGAPHTTGFTFDEEVTRVQEMEEDVGNLAGRLNNVDVRSGGDGGAHIEDEGSAHQTFEKSESAKSATVGKIVSGIHTENSNSDYPSASQ